MKELNSPDKIVQQMTRDGTVEREDDNLGVQAAHFSERTAESAVRKFGEVHSRLKFEPKHNNVKVSKKTIQKSKIKRDYARAFRQGDFESVKKTADKAKNAAKKAEKSMRDTAKFVKKHWKGITIFVVAALLLIVILSGSSACMNMFSGAFNAVIGSSYTSADEDILGADADYAALEAQLAEQIDNIPNDYPRYDEYNFYLDGIGHDPFALASYLTVIYNGYTRAGIQSELAAVFAQQYRLIITTITEIRYRTEMRTMYYADADGVLYSYEYYVEVPYNYYIMNVWLVNNGVDYVAVSNLTAEQYEIYLLYMETKGNRPDLFA